MVCHIRHTLMLILMFPDNVHFTNDIMIGTANANLWNLTTFRLYEVLSVQIIAIQSNFYAVLGQIITFGDYNKIENLLF